MFDQGCSLGVCSLGGVCSGGFDRDVLAQGGCSPRGDVRLTVLARGCSPEELFSSGGDRVASFAYSCSPGAGQMTGYSPVIGMRLKVLACEHVRLGVIAWGVFTSGSADLRFGAFACGSSLA